MSSDTQKNSTVLATSTGVTGGTVLVGVINLIPEHETIKQILTLISPTVTITLRYFVLTLENFFTQATENFGTNKNLKNVLKGIESIHQSSDTSENLKKDLEDMKRDAIKAHFEVKIAQIRKTIKK